MTVGDGEHTFLIADLAGFTALTEAHGDEEAADLAGDFFEAVRGLLDEHGAQEVKTIGDAILLRVPDAAQAVGLGLRIVDEIAEREAFPVVRVGMHTGPATERAGDWFGAAVNLAARVSASAGGAEVLLTEATRTSAGELEDVELRRHGTERFRNVADPVTLYRALAAGGEVDAGMIDPVCRMAVDPGRSVGACGTRASSTASAPSSALGRLPPSRSGLSPAEGRGPNRRCGYSRAAVIGLREALRRRHRRILAGVAIAAVALVLSWEHSGQGVHDMGDSMVPTLTTCFAILGTAIPATLLALSAMRRRRAVSPSWVVAVPPSVSVVASGLPAPPARAGPELLQSFRC